MPLFVLKPRTLLSAAIISLASVGAQADRIEMNRLVVSAGQTLDTAIVIDQYRADNVYFAARSISTGQYWFLNAQGAFVAYQSGQPTPSVLSAPQPGRYSVFALSVPADLTGGFNVYMLRAQAGVDLLAEVLGKSVTRANVDLGTLKTQMVQINLPRSVTGDHNDDGFPDDDGNHDGYHDDDANHDGYHDDDGDEDGYHDDDHDHDGEHDGDGDDEDGDDGRTAPMRR